jgi:hypothetical protein
MQMIYSKLIQVDTGVHSGRPIFGHRKIELEVHYEAQTIKDKRTLTAEPYELGANIEGVIYINGEACDLATLKLIAEEVRL